MLSKLSNLKNYKLGMSNYAPHCSLWVLKYMSSILVLIVPNSPVEGYDVADNSKYGRGQKRRSEDLNSTITLAKPSKYL